MTDPPLPGAELLEIERSVIRGWPALQTVHIHGWLARWSSGGSVRANSVAPFAYDGHDLDRAIAEVVAFYRRFGGVPRFLISEVVQPAGLDDALETRDWQRSGANFTYVKDIDAAPRAANATNLTIEQSARSSAAWNAIYLAGLSGDRRGIALKLVEGTPEPRTFFAAVRDGRVIASGLSIRDGRLASVQCMATLPDARRTGAATAILVAIEAAARANGVARLYLQVDASNVPAISVYERFDFRLVSRYHTRELVA